MRVSYSWGSAVPLMIAVILAVFAWWPQSPFANSLPVGMALLIAGAILTLLSGIKLRHYCYLSYDSKDLMSGANPIRLWLSCSGPLRDIEFTISSAVTNFNPDHALYGDQGSFFISARSRSRRRLGGKKVPRGDYAVEFNTRNDGWKELLSIKDGHTESVLLQYDGQSKKWITPKLISN